MLKNTSDTYGLVAKALHWISALIVLGLLSIGFFMSDMGFSEQKLTLYALHKSFGTLLLVLVALRIIWKLSTPKPNHLDTHQPWEKLLSKAVHIILYGLLILMPVSGWIMSSAGDFPHSFFGLFEMPDIVPKDKALFSNSREAHEIMAFIIIAIIGLHAAGAFKHHFIDKDVTLKRMSVPSLGLKGGIVMLLLSCIALGTPVTLVALHLMKESAQAPTPVSEAVKVEAKTTSLQSDSSTTPWTIISDQSAITFDVIQYGQLFNAAFKSFTGTINFDPADLANSVADITIDIASIDTGSSDRDDQARSAEWFDIVAFSKARFTTTSFKALEPNHYEAVANLTIRDVTLPLTLPFTLEIDEATNRATMRANLTLSRLDFGVGQGQWRSTDAIDDAIALTITVTAQR